MDDFPQMQAQAGFLAVPQPPEPPVEEAAESGATVFETAVAVKGGVMSIEVIETPSGPVLQLITAGGARKPAPVKFDRYQTAALRMAICGAANKVEDL